MLGSGIIQGMVQALKTNASQLTKRSRLKDINKKYSGDGRHVELEFPTATKEELDAFHLQLIREKRRSTIILVSLAIFFFLVTFVVILFLIR